MQPRPSFCGKENANYVYFSFSRSLVRSVVNIFSFFLRATWSNDQILLVIMPTYFFFKVKVLLHMFSIGMFFLSDLFSFLNLMSCNVNVKSTGIMKLNGKLLIYGYDWCTCFFFVVYTLWNASVRIAILLEMFDVNALMVIVSGFK